MCGYVPGLHDAATAGAGSTDSDAAGASEIAAAATGGTTEVPVELLAAAPTERIIDAHEIRANTLLAIDTALGTSVALGIDGKIFEVSSDDARGHAEVIGSLLQRVFEFAEETLAGAEPAEVNPARVDHVVAGIGPGPFTGLRVGIAAAHAFAAGRSVPLLPLQSHEAVALAVLERGAASTVRVVQDAKRRELFVTKYSGLNWAGVPMRLADPRIEARETFAEAGSDVWPERIPAARLVQLAARRLHTGGGFEEDRALYLRAPDVKPAAAVKRVSA